MPIRVKILAIVIWYIRLRIVLGIWTLYSIRIFVFGLKLSYKTSQTMKYKKYIYYYGLTFDKYIL